LIHASGVATEEGDRIDAFGLITSDDFRGGHSHLSALERIGGLREGADSRKSATTNWTQSCCSSNFKGNLTHTAEDVGLHSVHRQYVDDRGSRSHSAGHKHADWDVLHAGRSILTPLFCSRKFLPRT
jgi:hypothetical protein